MTIFLGFLLVFTLSDVAGQIFEFPYMILLFNVHANGTRQQLMNFPFWYLFQMAYYGHALYDAEATIVHHFAHYKNPTWFPYPMLSAGVVFTGALLRR